MALTPDSLQARRVLPDPLYRALTHVYAQRDFRLNPGRGERRSPDTTPATGAPTIWNSAPRMRTPTEQRFCRLARSLTDARAQVELVLGSAQYFKARCLLQGHRFTVDVVLDANLHAAGESRVADDGVAVAGVGTLLRQKAATLVSRCGEKDLYDLSLAVPRDTPASTCRG